MNGSADMKVEFGTDKQVIDGITVLAVRGRVDAFVYSLFRDRLTEAIDEGEQKLVLDLTQTENINTTCVGLIVSRMKQCRDMGGDVKLAGPSDYLRRILQLIGVVKVFEIFPDAPQAARAFNPQP